jgi:hypothetical protein
MRIDRLQIAVRPRGVLECLDLALVVCGRRPLGVAVAAAIGVLPMILLNRAVFAGAPEDDESVLALAVALTLEMPWATAPLTLFLGQAVFSERFTAASWRECLRAFAGAIWPLLLFQGFFRGGSLVMCFAAPFFFPAAYYLGPVILLERGRTGAIAGRCLQLTRAALGQIMLLSVIDAALLGCGWLAGVVFLESFTVLWRGGTLWDVAQAVFDPYGEAGDVATAAVRAVVSWPSQLAFWNAACLVAVFRFFTYLDTRIRHEGWDVELKFRAPATYAGLRPGQSAVAMLAAICLAAWGGVARAAPAADGADAAARAAVVKQRFPWYDAQADAYRPMVMVVPEQAAAPSLPRMEGLGAIAKLVMIAGLAAVVAAAVWLLVRYGLDLRRGDRRRAAPAAAVLGAEALEALPEAARRHDGDLLAEAARLAAAGDHAAAMVLFHGWQLVQLHGRGVIELARGKTTRRYASEVAAAAPEIADLFRRSNRLFEDALFGRLPVSATAFAGVWDRRHEFTAAGSREAGA